MDRGAGESLFLTPGRLTKSGKGLGGGVRPEPDNFVKRALKPVLKELGLDGAAHAFRHGNATLLDLLHPPMACSARTPWARGCEDDHALTVSNLLMS